MACSNRSRAMANSISSSTSLTLRFPFPIFLCASDCSDLRQVPDTQEVYLSPDSDTSLVIEILEHVEPTASSASQSTQGSEAEAIIRFHFDALAHDNAAESQSVTEVSASSSTSTIQEYTSSDPSSLRALPTPPPSTLTGTQRVKKFNSQQADEVRVRVAVWRVDLVSSERSGGSIGKLRRRADVVASVNVNLSSVDGGDSAREEADRVGAWFGRAVQGMRIVDYGLFEEVEEQETQ